MCINLFGLFICYLLWDCYLVCFVWVDVAVLFVFAIGCLGVWCVLFGGACGFRFALLFLLMFALVCYVVLFKGLVRDSPLGVCCVGCFVCLV